jgi:hypothetical protein
VSWTVVFALRRRHNSERGPVGHYSQNMTLYILYPQIYQLELPMHYLGLTMTMAGKNTFFRRRQSSEHGCIMSKQSIYVYQVYTVILVHGLRSSYRPRRPSRIKVHWINTFLFPGLSLLHPSNRLTDCHGGLVGTKKRLVKSVTPIN